MAYYKNDIYYICIKFICFIFICCLYDNCFKVGDTKMIFQLHNYLLNESKNYKPLNEKLPF